MTAPAADPNQAWAVLASARPARVRRLLDRLGAARPLDLVHTPGFPVAGFADVNRVCLPDARFAAGMRSDLVGRYAAVAYPLSHAHRDRYEYGNVEEFAAGLAAVRLLRFYAHDFLEEVPMPESAAIAAHHAAAAARLAARKAERLAELAEFAGISVTDAAERCVQAERQGCAAWRAAAPRSREEIAAFYRDHDFYLYQLTRANFFAGGRTEYLDDIGSWLKSGMKVLELGPGVGEVALELARRGACVSVVDVNPRLLEFIRTKARRRGLALHAGREIPEERFEAVLALDVLEHLADPADTLDRLIARLTGPRLVMLRLPEEEEEDVPMHFPGTRRVVEDLLRLRGFRRLPSRTDLDVYANRAGDRDT